VQVAQVLGVDLGGTRCRALLADTDGTRYRAGYARGAHPGSDLPAALAAVAGAVSAALDGTPPAAVRGVVLGAAGYAAVAEPSTAQALRQVWTAAGLRCPVRVRPDCEVAFAAGTADPNGTVLVAGTGSMAARIVDHSMSSRIGGHGWVLGDEGSGFWLGREAVRATLRVLEVGGPPSELVGRVLAAVLGGSPPPTDPLRTIGAVTSWVHRKAPAGLAALAPLVCAAAQVGDAEAGALLERAAGLLADLALALGRTDEPMVLTGGLLTASPIAALVDHRLRAAGVRVHHSGDTAAGAAWLAALEIRALGIWTGDVVTMHLRMLGHLRLDPATGSAAPYPAQSGMTRRHRSHQHCPANGDAGRYQWPAQRDPRNAERHHGIGRPQGHEHRDPDQVLPHPHPGRQGVRPEPDRVAPPGRSLAE
jgi:glucosamine kinase